MAIASWSVLERQATSKWPKTLPKITDQGVAREVAELMIQNNFFHPRRRCLTRSVCCV